jgi:hypothetical protein
VLYSVPKYVYPDAEQKLEHTAAVMLDELVLAPVSSRGDPESV